MFEQGESASFKLKVNGTGSPDDITKIELTQRITPTGSEVSRQELDFIVEGEVEFDINKAYVQGDRVSYNGHIYEARWWTKGEIPGSSQRGAWLFIQ